jgi:hypothetical protein
MRHATWRRSRRSRSATPETHAVIPFRGPPTQGIYERSEDAPPGCLLVGEVDDTYRIGEREITVGQYVTFLNTVDPEGTNARNLYSPSMSPVTWPRYGSIRLTTGRDIASGEQYTVASADWEQKPIGFIDFRRAAG